MHPEFTLTTPALLFSAISLILLAYTNRFTAYAALVRNLYATYKENPSYVLKGQIDNLRNRVYLIRSMQIFGVSSLFLCVLTMLLLYLHLKIAAIWVFGIALALLIISLGLSIREIMISVRALELHFSDMESDNE